MGENYLQQNCFSYAHGKWAGGCVVVGQMVGMEAISGWSWANPHCRPGVLKPLGVHVVVRFFAPPKGSHGRLKQYTP